MRAIGPMVLRNDEKIEDIKLIILGTCAKGWDFAIPKSLHLSPQAVRNWPFQSKETCFSLPSYFSIQIIKSGGKLHLRFKETSITPHSQDNSNIISKPRPTSLILSVNHFKTNFFNFHQQQQVSAEGDQERMQTQITLRELRDRPKPKNVKKLERQIKECVKSRHGHWKRFEQVKYIQFIRKYYYIMRSSLLRYHYRIFTTMAEEIGSRNAVQCKSHHQKMLKKANYCIENLIFTESDLSSPIRVGEGLEGNHFQSVKLGIKNVATNENVPYFIIQTGPKMLIVIDERFVGNY